MPWAMRPPNSLSAAHSASVWSGWKSPVRAEKATRSASVIVRPRRGEALAGLELRRSRAERVLPIRLASLALVGEIALDAEVGAQREGDLAAGAFVAERRGVEAVGGEVGAVAEAGVADDFEAGDAGGARRPRGSRR